MRAILTYHSIDPSGSPISVAPEQFARHVKFLASGAVRVLPLETLLDDSDPRPAVALTFDDGFENFASEAWPRLREHGLPTTVFVATQRVGGDNRWEERDTPGIPTLPLLDWEQLGRLAADGLSLGAHSRTHPHLASLSAAQLSDEVEGSRSDLATRLGVDARGFCYPFGEVDERSRAAVERVYRWACTTELAALAPQLDRSRLPRLDAYYLREPGALEAFGSARFRLRIFARRQARRVRGWLPAQGWA